MDHGAGITSPERLIYVAEFAIGQLKDVDALVVLGARDPVSFFAYPTCASMLRARRVRGHRLGPPGTDTHAALSYLVDALRSPIAFRSASGEVPEVPKGALTTTSARRSDRRDRARRSHHLGRIKHERCPHLWRHADSPRRTVDDLDRWRHRHGTARSRSVPRWAAAVACSRSKLMAR